MTNSKTLFKSSLKMKVLKRLNHHLRSKLVYEMNQLLTELRSKVDGLIWTWKQKMKYRAGLLTLSQLPVCKWRLKAPTNQVLISMRRNQLRIKVKTSWGQVINLIWKQLFREATFIIINHLSRESLTPIKCPLKIIITVNLLKFWTKGNLWETNQVSILKAQVLSKTEWGVVINRRTIVTTSCSTH